MNTKNLMVSFVAIAMALFLVATVSAIDIEFINVDGMYPTTLNGNVSVTAGEIITIKVYLTAETDTLSDVVIKAELDGVEVETEEFDVIEGNSYRKVLDIKVPYDFDNDEPYKDVELEITAEGEDEDGVDVEATYTATLNIQRPDYNVEIKPIHVPSIVEAGETFSVDVVVENTGYKDLDDLYITARISELGIEETFYLGDLTDVVEDEDDSTIHKRLNLKVPYDAQAGEYILEVEVSNEDAVLSSTIVVTTENSLPEQVIKSGNELILINPTDKVAVYTIIAGDSASVSEKIVVVEADSSERVTVTSNVEGEYDVVILDAEGEIVKTVTFSGSEEASQIASPIVILTVVLGIVFLVLLVVLIVLVTKKPEKAEEFGESYY